MGEVRRFINRISGRWIAVGLVAMALLMTSGLFRIYLIPEFSLWLAVLAIPIVFEVPVTGRLSLRWGIPAVVLVAAFPFLHVQSCLLLGTGLACLFFIESFHGRLSHLAAYLLVLCWPFVSYFVTVFGFPIRLWLTEVSASLLTLIGQNVQADGNRLIWNGHLFSVEPACMGLKMVETSLVLSLVILAFYQRKKRRYLMHWHTWIVLGFTLLLVVLANLMRISGLILFQSQEGTMSHELIGMLCLMVYVIGPLLFLISWAVGRFGVAMDETQPKPFSSTFRNLRLGITALLIALLALFGINRAPYIHADEHLIAIPMELPGYAISEVGFGGYKAEDSRSLVYIKPAKNFWSPDHNPMVCWRGSGYAFKNERMITVAGNQVYTAELVKGEDRLYTAWWFTNGESTTISQWNWRWNQATGAPIYFLVNLSCADEETLEVQVEEWVKRY